ASDLNRSGSIQVVPAGYRPTLDLAVAVGVATQWDLGHPTIARAMTVTKRGGGTLVFDAANAYEGPTTVVEGTLRVDQADALANSQVTIEPAATLAISDGVVMRAAGIALAGGRVDVGTGGIRIGPGGTSAAALRADLLAGREGGSWHGASGIMSSAAGSGRGLGYLVAADGSAIVAYAAAGDADLDGTVNVFDLVSVNVAGGFGTGGATDWAKGDFNYDSVTNVFDLVATNTASVYGQGSYLPETLAGSVTNLHVSAVPEPRSVALLLIAGIAGLAAHRRRPLEGRILGNATRP
ncbi:MAG: hypothetical protein RLZZ440_1179, partial [Planctomycetota bacterium]